MEIEKIVEQFRAEQGWNSDSLLALLTSFLQTHSSYWPKELPATTDLQQFLQNVADEENSWPRRD